MELLVFELMTSDCKWFFFRLRIHYYGSSTYSHDTMKSVTSCWKKPPNVRYLYWKASVTWVKCPTFLSSLGPPIVKSFTSSYQSLTTPAQLRSLPAEAKFCPTGKRPVDIECTLSKDLSHHFLIKALFYNAKNITNIICNKYDIILYCRIISRRLLSILYFIYKFITKQSLRYTVYA